MSARRWLQTTAGAVDRLHPPPDGVVVLIYHRVGGESDSVIDLPADVFEQQMKRLTTTANVLTLDDAVAQIAAGRSDRGVVITFDDGTLDFHEVAVPILERYGLPATLYAATGPIDRQQALPWGAPSATWDGLRRAVATGLVSIGSHTRDHALLNHGDRSDVALQLDSSVASITEQIGTAPRHFAYPKAVRGNVSAEIEVRTRFTSAALAGSRVNIGNADLHRLGRTPIHRTDSMDVFDRKVAGGLRLEGVLRDAATRWRNRAARQ